MTESVLDPVASRAVTEAAIEQCEEGTTEDTAAALLEAVRVTARKHKILTADEVWETLGQHHGSSQLGPVMRRAAKQGWIKRASGERQSIRKVAHSKPQRLWESTIYVGESHAIA